VYANVAPQFQHVIASMATGFSQIGHGTVEPFVFRPDASLS